MKRKHLKRVVAGAFAAVMATSGISFPQANVHAEEKGNELRLWYDEPTSQGTNILGQDTICSAFLYEVFYRL